jgi:H+/Cl- antiporter ClcA
MRSSPPSAPRPEARRDAARPAAFPWDLLAWAAVVGLSTGLAVVAFHELVALVNDVLFGPLIEGLTRVGRETAPFAPPPSSPLEPAFPLPLPQVTSATPLQALLQLGLGGIGFLPPQPALPPPASAVATRIGWLELWPVVVVPTLGGLAVALLRRAGGRLGPGLPSLMAMAEGAQAGEPRLPLQRLLVASLSLGSGASLGPEGPSVESGGNLGLWLALRGGLPPDSRRTLVAAGAAAGLAAGFKAPIAGVFFAFEGSFSAPPGRPALRAVLVAAVVATLVTQLCLGEAPILRLPAYEVRSVLELPLYLGLGVVASGMSWLLLRLLSFGREPRLQRFLARLPLGLPTALGGAAVGGMALAFPQVLGVGYDTIEALLGSEHGVPLLTLGVLIGMKLLASTVSNATGFVGGGFAPALFLGAVLGNAYGQLLGEGGLGLPIAEPPAYAMVGMAAVLAGSARAPLTSLLLLFELTRDIRIVVPLMAAAGLSAVLVERWQGLHDPGLLGPDPLEEERRGRLARLPVAAAFEPEAPLVLPQDLAATEALARLVDAHGHCLVVAESGADEASVRGVATLADLQRALAAPAAMERTVLLGECLRGDLVWLPLAARLDRLEDQLTPSGLRQVPVFEVSWAGLGALPRGLPAQGLPVAALKGLASRDGMARALARQAQAAVSERGAISASATGSA